MERFCNCLLLGIENRGKHATGFVAVDADGSTILDKKDITASEFIRTRKAFNTRTRTVLLHTRFATQGDPEEWNNNHPVFAGSVFTVHNGTIYNDDELFKEHKIKRIGEVDSEIIPALLNKYTFDEPEKAFGELGGGFATASIDPVRYPGTVVLSKGGSWPLAVLNAKHFVVWASTESAIKDAWGACFGTPPGTKSFEHLFSGDIWVLTEAEVDKRRQAFSHLAYGKSYKYSGASATYADDWDDYYSGESWTTRSHRGSYSPPKGARTVLDTSDRVSQLRASGKAHGVTHVDKNTAKNKKFLDEHGNGKWTYCVHCKTTVADVQFTDHDEYGRICCDCLSIAKEIARKAEASPTRYLGLVGLDVEQFKILERFADLQTYVHNQALYAISNATGIKRTTVDFLLFRADTAYLESDRAILGLYCDLSDRYQEESALIWDKYMREQQSKTGSGYVACAAGVHKMDEACEACGSSCSTDAEETHEVGVQVFEEAKLAKLPDKCMTCRRKPKTFLGTKLAWCTRCWNECDEKGCKERSKGYLADGTRFCHTHARGVKGFIFDGDAQARKEKERVRVYA